jgi:hypothetical protein
VTQWGTLAGPTIYICLLYTVLFYREEDTEAKYYADGEDAYEMRKYFTEAAAAKSKRRRGSKSGTDKQRRGSSAADSSSNSSSSTPAEKVPAAGASS